LIAWSFADKLFQSFSPANSSPDRDSFGRLAGGRTVQFFGRLFRKKAQSRPESAVAASAFQGHASVPREQLQKQMREYPAIIDGNENN